MQFGLFQTTEQSDLFVATDLTTKTVPISANSPAEICEGTKTFRRLDVPFLLWIESRVANIDNAYRKGKASASVHTTVEQRFAVIRKWAKENIDAALLEAMRRNFDPKSYSPPVSEPTPPVTENWSIAMHEAFEERAAIMEFDGGLSRAKAEQAAEISIRSSFNR
ncbi:MAG: hypothetical protein OEM52_02880 [bacterium]|nr:hypothetical protein [bacterium]